ncbi:hypothetical protein [Streptomyces lonarensis]|uniref:hypothetical protein n=1 Tax=Streptomyces lonarensis TaxID=700599 RepID=UPI001ADD9C53|nr:hypothetical protein [Streptomyces lonarensis]
MPCELSRRTLLAGGGVLLAAALTGCSATGPRQAAERAERSAGAQRLREETEADSRLLLARYDATLATHPDLADRLLPLRGTVAEHLAAVVAAAGATTASARPGGEGAAAGDAGAPADATAVPAEPEAAVSELSRSEAEVSERRLVALADAPPELARLLASLAAAGATQCYLLDGALPEDEPGLLPEAPTTEEAT